MPKLWKKNGVAKNNSDLEEADLSKLAISKPTVVYFPGQLTTDDNHNFISMDLNDVKRIFHDMPEPPQVYLWSHPEEHSPEKKMSLTSLFRTAVHKLSLRRLEMPADRDLKSLFRLAAYKLSFHTSSISETDDLAQKLVMPLVSNAEGQRLSFEEAQKNLRNLTFVGYCYGGLAAQGVYNAARGMMRKAGYSKEETRKLLKEIVLVSFGTFSEPKEEQNRYTTVSLLYNDDNPIGKKELLMHPVHKAFSRFSRRLKIEQLSDSSILVSATAMGSWWDRDKETQKEVIENVQLPRWHKDAFNHFFTDYVSTNDKSNQFSRIVPYALMNAVNRKDTVSPMDLLKVPPGLEKTPEAASYKRKIARAAGHKM